MDKNKWIWIIVWVIILGILLYIPRMGKKVVTINVPCLAPNVPLKQHIHPVLKITVDGKQETIPANIGLGACERALHTHDTTGVIHVEAQDNRVYILDDFMSVAGKTIERAGYAVTITVDGKPNAEFGKLLLKDKQEIVVEYKKK